jgi:hypothetical protein
MVFAYLTLSGDVDVELAEGHGLASTMIITLTTTTTTANKNPTAEPVPVMYGVVSSQSESGLDAHAIMRHVSTTEEIKTLAVMMTIQNENNPATTCVITPPPLL